MRNKIRNLKLFVKNTLETPLLYRYPLFISYPRSGAHWINSLMEVYFNRPRLRRGRPTFLDRRRRDWMWIHDHDSKLKIFKKICKKGHKYPKILFLYRSPLDVIFSQLNAAQQNYEEFGYLFKEKNFKDKDYAFSKKIVKRELNNWKKYHQTYLTGFKNFKFTYINYDSFKDSKKRDNEFKKICEHFNRPFNKKRFNFLFKKYGKLDLDKNKKLNKKDYLNEKKKFIIEYGEMIKQSTKKVEQDFKLKIK